MPKQNYERSPRQRLEWFGGFAELALSTSTVDGATAENAVILSATPRLALSAGTVDAVGFPAGIVRGETCSIARFIGSLSVYDVDRRQQNISYDLAAGLIKQEVEDSYVSDPVAAGVSLPAPDALSDLRASWLWHAQEQWNPQSAGANYTVAKMDWKIDSTNSRIFESNDVIQLSVNARTRVNSGAATQVDFRCTLLWRCLLRLD